MKKTALFMVTLALAMLIALNGAVSAYDFVEGFNVNQSFRGGSVGDIWFGIGYTPTVSYNLKRVELMAGVANGLYIIQLRLDNGTGWPSSGVLRQGSFPLVDTIGWQGADFNSSYYVTAGTQYWIVIKPVIFSQQSIAWGGTPIVYVYGDANSWQAKSWAYWMVKFFKDSVPVNTVLHCSLTPNPVFVGQTVSLIGNLTTMNGIPIPGVQVTIKSNGTPAGTLMTNSTGWFTASGQIASAGTYNVSCSYAGSSEYFSSSCWTMLTVNKAQTEILARLSPNIASPGATVTLKGILIDQFSIPIKSATVNLQYSNNYGVTWTPFGNVTTNSKGIFSKTFTAPPIGIYIYRMNYTGSSSHLSCTTEITLVVR